MMKFIKVPFLDYLATFLKGVNNDEMVIAFFNIKVNDLEMMVILTRKTVNPFFATYSKAFRRKLDDSLSWHLCYDKIEFERLVNSNFQISSNIRSLLNYFMYGHERGYLRDDYQMITNVKFPGNRR